MKALLLAAGRGTRLGALTANRPKPMLPIGGVPMIERIMAGIAAEAAIREFVLVTGYRADVLQDYFGDGSRWGWQIQYVQQDAPRGVGDAVNCARAVLAADAVPDDLRRHHAGPRQLRPLRGGLRRESGPHPRDRKPIVGLNWVDDPWAGAAVYLHDEDNIIQRIQEKPAKGTATTHWNNAGLFIFDPLIFDYTAKIVTLRARRVRTARRHHRHD